MRYIVLNTNQEKNLCVQQNSGEIYTPSYVTTMNNVQQYSPTKKVKRFRSAFTTDQVHYLEQQFKKFPYIGNAQRKEVAISLNIPERAVKIWFQNRRMKEKKETGAKEFDDDRSNQRSVEFAKDQLNNVNASANDQRQYSLPMLTQIKKPIANKTVVTNNSCSTIRQPVEPVGAQYYRESNNTKTHPAPIAETTSPYFHKGSGEFSSNLGKTYKSELSNKLHAERLLRKKEIKQDSEPKPINYVSCLTDEQILPEDLSSNRKTNVPAAPIQATSTSRDVPNAGYFSVLPTISPLYAQPYISPGMLWNRISVMPVVSSGSSPIPALNHQSGIAPGTLGVPKINCNCDCHIQPHVSVALQQNNPNPQYIITALPFQNPSAKF